MRHILNILLILLTFGCVIIETVEVKDKIPSNKEVIDSNIIYDFINETGIISQTGNNTVFNINYIKKEKIISKSKVTYNIITKLYLPCENNINELCIKNNFLSDKATFSSKSDFFQKMFLATITIIGIPSWYYYYSALQQDGTIKKNITEEESSEEKDVKLKPINGFLLLGSNLKSKKIPIKGGKFSIISEELFALNFESLPNLKDNISIKANYQDYNYIVSDEIKEEKMKFSIFRGLPEDQYQLLNGIQKKYNDSVCKKYNREELYTLHNTYISEYKFDRPMTNEEIDVMSKKYTSKELYCADHFYETNFQIFREAINRKNK